MEFGAFKVLRSGEIADARSLLALVTHVAVSTSVLAISRVSAEVEPTGSGEMPLSHISTLWMANPCCSPDLIMVEPDNVPVAIWYCFIHMNTKSNAIVPLGSCQAEPACRGWVRRASYVRS